MKYTDIPDSNKLHSYFLVAPSRNKTAGEFKILIKQYKYDPDCFVFRCEDGTRVYGPTRKYEKDSEYPENNLIVFYGEVDYKRALKMFLKQKKQVILDKEKINPSIIKPLDLEYVKWLENELKSN